MAKTKVAKQVSDRPARVRKPKKFSAPVGKAAEERAGVEETQVVTLVEAPFETAAATKSSPVAKITRSKAARANISEGTRLYALAGRPTKAQFVKVYGAKGPKMTWEQRAAAGVDAKHFQEALKAKS